MSKANVVAISRQFGSGGARIGREVAARLGLRYADRDILDQAARALQVEVGDVEPLDENVRGFWERLGSVFAQAAAGMTYTPPTLPSVDETDIFAAERSIIESLAARGGAVIVGRGAAHVLRGRPNVLSVFLHAPLAARIALALEEYTFPDERTATAMVRSTDEQRARFAETLTGRHWSDATLYDLSIDTASVGFARAVDLIVALVERPDAASRP